MVRPHACHTRVAVALVALVLLVAAAPSTVLAGPVPAEGIDAVNETPDVALDLAINQQVNPAIRTLYATVDLLPNPIPNSAQAQVRYDPVTRTLIVFGDANNDGDEDQDEKFPFSGNTGVERIVIEAPANAKVRDAYPTEAAGIDYTIFDDANGNDAHDAGEAAVLRLAVLLFPATGAGACTGAQTFDPAAAQCVRIIVQSPPAGLDESHDLSTGATPPVGAQVTVQTFAANDGTACIPPATGQLSVPRQDSDFPPTGTVGCVRVTVAVEGQPPTSQDVPVEEAPALGAQVTVQTFAANNGTACTGAPNGQVSVPPQDGEGPPTGTIACVRITVEAEGQPPTTQDVPVQETPALGAQITVQTFAAHDETTMACIPPANGQLSVPPQAGETPPGGAIGCIRIIVAVEGQDPVSQDVPVEQAPPAPTAEPRLFFLTKTAGELLRPEDLQGAPERAGDVRGVCAGVIVRVAGQDPVSFPPAGTTVPPEVGGAVPPGGPALFVQDGMLCARQPLVDPASLQPETLDTNGNGILDAVCVTAASEDPAAPPARACFPLTLLPIEDFDQDGYNNADELPPGATTLQQIVFGMFDPQITNEDLDGDGFSNSAENDAGTAPDCWADHPNRPPVLGDREEEADEGDLLTFSVAATDPDYDAELNDAPTCLFGFSIIFGRDLATRIAAGEVPTLETTTVRAAAGSLTPVLIKANPSLALGAVRDVPSVACPDAALAALPGDPACVENEDGSATVSWAVPHTAVVTGSGVFTVTFTATDDEGATDTGDVDITVRDRLTPILLDFEIGGLPALPPFELHELETLDVTVIADDVEGHSFTIVAEGIAGSPCAFAQTPGTNTGLLSCDPDQDVVDHDDPDEPEEVFEITFNATSADDPDREPGLADVDVTVNDVNRAPTAVVTREIPAAPIEGDTLEIDVDVNDADDDDPELDVEGTDVCEDGEFELADANNDGLWLFSCTLGEQVSRGESLDAELTFTADDGWGPDPLTDEVTEDVTIGFRNLAPVVENMVTDASPLTFVNGNTIAYVLVGELLTVTAVASDPDAGDEDLLVCTVEFGDGPAVGGTEAVLPDDTVRCTATHTYVVDSPDAGFAVTVVFEDPDAADSEVRQVNALTPALDADLDGLFNGAELDGTDNDGESHDFGPTDPYEADTDQDLSRDLQEVNADSDPNDLHSTPTDYDGDGMLNSVDVRPFEPGPLWVLVTFYDEDQIAMPPQDVLADPTKVVSICVYLAAQPLVGGERIEPLGPEGACAPPPANLDPGMPGLGSGVVLDLTYRERYDAASGACDGSTVATLGIQLPSWLSEPVVPRAAQEAGCLTADLSFGIVEGSASVPVAWEP